MFNKASAKSQMFPLLCLKSNSFNFTILHHHITWSHSGHFSSWSLTVQIGGWCCNSTLAIGGLTKWMNLAAPNTALRLAVYDFLTRSASLSHHWHLPGPACVRNTPPLISSFPLTKMFRLYLVNVCRGLMYTPEGSVHAFCAKLNITLIWALLGLKCRWVEWRCS